jgi:hypothetical protein
VTSGAWVLQGSEARSKPMTPAGLEIDTQVYFRLFVRGIAGHYPVEKDI